MSVIARYSREEERTLSRLRENVRLLVNGYEEVVDYKIQLAYHRDTCRHYERTTRPQEDCVCPSVEEARTRRSRTPGLLYQLDDFRQHKDVDRNPKAARGAPRVKKPKSHPELAGFFALDEITVDVYATVDRALEEAGRDRAWGAQPVFELLSGLVTHVKHFVQQHPDAARRIADRSESWVSQARNALKITVGDAIFEGTVCGNCGGGLATPWDNSGDVRCVGSPGAAPCGETYPMSEWLAMYERGKQA